MSGERFGWQAGDLTIVRRGQKNANTEPGHEFYGNQYSGGGGAADTTERSQAGEEKRPYLSMRDALAGAAAVHEEHGAVQRPYSGSDGRWYLTSKPPTAGGTPMSADQLHEAIHTFAPEVAHDSLHDSTKARKNANNEGGHEFLGNQYTGGGGAGDGVKDSTHAEWMQARELATAKAAAAPVPTKEAIAKNAALYEKVGSQRAHMLTRGNTTDRANSRAKLLTEFGNGTHAPCVWCGKQLDDKSVTRDHIIPMDKGGTFQYANLIPACGSCNSARGDRAFSDFMNFKSIAGTLFRFRGKDGAVTQYEGTEPWVVTLEFDREPETVTGELVKRHVAALDYTQAEIAGVQVDPKTIRKAG
jgi:5-methylcytosine-specific restriction endonuclease McrA